MTAQLEAFPGAIGASFLVKQANETQPKPKRPNDRRGTSNKNVSGNSYARRARKLWILKTFAADVVLVLGEFDSLAAARPETREAAERLQRLYGNEMIVMDACRCYRCGTLLSYETLEVDRIIPGCLGGTYRRNNIRPACGDCNKVTGNEAKALKAKQGKR